MWMVVGVLYYTSVGGTGMMNCRRAVQGIVERLLSK